jgi:hypothetical protein
LGELQHIDRNNAPPATFDLHLEVASVEVLNWTTLTVDDLDIDSDELDTGTKRRLLRGECQGSRGGGSTGRR